MGLRGGRKGIARQGEGRGRSLGRVRTATARTNTWAVAACGQRHVQLVDVDIARLTPRWLAPRAGIRGDDIADVTDPVVERDETVRIRWYAAEVASGVLRRH